ncbi:hypothetical protein [Microcoleus sp. S28C3]
MPRSVLRSCAPSGFPEAARALGCHPVETNRGKLLLLLARG